jgi:aspartate kinase
MNETKKGPGAEEPRMDLPIVVQKYGGSSVADIEKLERVAARVVETVEGGKRVVVVVSAMGKTTDELLRLARSVDPSPHRRELDMLLSAGERISASLLAMAIIARGHEAISFTGSQCGILTNHRHTDARILEVRPYRVQDELDRGRVVVIAGFQGVSYKREITTLGRGGSDTTAVAMAAALGAEYCEICSDVDGVYTADPRVVEAPVHLETISYPEMQELALHGARVLNAQAVEFARRAGIAICARATSGSERATRVVGEHGDRAGRAVGVAGMQDLVCVHGDGGQAQLARFVQILEEREVAPLRAALIDGQPQLVISRLNCPDYACLREKLEAAGGMVWFEEGLEAASVVGEGLGDDPGHLSRLLTLAERLELPIHSVDSAPLRLTLFLRPGRLADAQRALHREFVEASLEEIAEPV